MSVICLTYNHAAYIRQALDGFVMQKTNFEFEVLIHDDASTDGTADIIREYQQKYPEIIKPIFQTENLYQQNKPMSKVFLYPLIKGEYVAFCEGDDYWTDENKLQKQVDFLDAHPDYTVCFHPVTVKWEDNSGKRDEIFPKPRYRFYKTTLNLADLLKHNFIQTNSVVYRWRLKDNVDLLPDGILPGDYFLHLLHAEVGKIGFLPDVMGIYRRHRGSVWFGAGQSDDFFIRNGSRHIAFLTEMQKRFGVDKSEAVNTTMARTICAFLKKGDFAPLGDLAAKFPQEWQGALNNISLLPNAQKYRDKVRKYKKICLILLLAVAVIFAAFCYAL